MNPKCFTDFLAEPQRLGITTLLAYTAMLRAGNARVSREREYEVVVEERLGRNFHWKDAVLIRIPAANGTFPER
jgi:hypothetical protein